MPHPGSSSDRQQLGQGLSSAGACPGQDQDQDQHSPLQWGWHSARLGLCLGWGRVAEQHRAWEEQSPGPQLQGSNTLLWAPDLLSLTPGHWKPPTNHRPQHHRIKYTDIFILSKVPQSGEGVPGSLGPPSQPRPEGGLKTPKSSSRPRRNLPKSPLPTPAECSFKVSTFCCSGVCGKGVGSLPAEAPGPQASEMMLFLQSS